MFHNRNDPKQSFYFPSSKCANIIISHPISESFQACQQPTLLNAIQLNLESTLEIKIRKPTHVMQNNELRRKE